MGRKIRAGGSGGCVCFFSGRWLFRFILGFILPLVRHVFSERERVLILLDQRTYYGSDFHAIFTQSGSIFRHFSMVPSTYILDSSDLA